MKTIQSFALKHTLIYCILAEILVLGGMMVAGTAVSVVVYVVLGWDVDYYVLMAGQEVFGALIALAAICLSGCSYIFKRRGIGFCRGLLVGGYFLFISVYTAVGLFVTYEGERVLKPWYLIVTFAVTMVLIGVTEEFLCRGVLAELLRRHYGATHGGIWRAVVVSGILFGLAHLTNLLSAKPMGVLVQCVSAAAMGMAFAAIYFRTGCIWVTVALHALVDFAALITGGLYRGTVDEVISEYTPVNLIAVVPYIVLLFVLLRKKKMDEIVERFAEEARQEIPRDSARPDLDWMR